MCLYSIGRRLKVVARVQEIGISKTAKEFGISRAAIRNWLKRYNIKDYPNESGIEQLKKLSWKREGNKANRHRRMLLALFHYRCYDCGLEDSTGEQLQHHLAYNLFPPQALILCIKCHKKRHVEKR